MNKKEKSKFGYYSQKAYEFGTSIYFNEKGEEVIVTIVSSADPKNISKEYKFDDVVFVGKVTKFVRVNTLSKNDILNEHQK